jgi:O-antigen/teichoic acid export membrane protein
VRLGRRRPLHRLAHGISRSEAGRLAGDSVYVAIWQGAVSIADLVQIALITHALGLTGYGRFALVVAFATLVDQFFDVRVGAAATTFGARALRQSAQAAAGTFQTSYLVDAATGVVGLVVLAGVAPIVGPHLIGENGTEFILLYALVLFASTLDDSSLAVLRLFDRFKLIATYTIMLEGTRVGLLVAALALKESLIVVFIVLIAYRLAAGLVNVTAASVVFRKASGGARLTRLSLGSASAERREMLRMVFHTNVVSYARLAQTQLPAILLGAISSATQVGVYKVGMAAAAGVGRVADPAYVAILPRLSRLWAAGRRAEFRRLIERASFVSVPAMIIAMGIVVLLRGPILEILGGASARHTAGTVLILGAVALALNGALFWNIGALFATGRSRTVAALAVAGAVTQVGFLVPLTIAFDAEGAAVAFLISMLWTNVVMAVLAFRAARAEGNQVGVAPVPEAATPDTVSEML